MSDEKKKVESEVLGVTSEQVLKAITDGMAMGVAMGAKQPQQVQLARGQRETVTNCQKCGQMLTKGGRPAGCQGKHVEMVVYPKKHGRFFQGAFINGVRYLSNHARHKITVPAENNIEYAVAQWEDSEDRMKEGRESNHNSGEMSATGKTSFNPAHGF